MTNTPTNNTATITNASVNTPTNAPLSLLSHFVEEKLAKLGYELVAIEVMNHREKVLRLFIDHLNDQKDDQNDGENRGISIEDCVKVTHELDEPLEASEVVMAVFKGPYELEVSSPGVDRPLQKPEAFQKFAGEIARIQTFRALSGEETQAPEYSAKNPKQKNFYGVLKGFEASSNAVLFGVIPEDGVKRSKAEIKNETLIKIPLELVAKAHLEPVLDLPEENKTHQKKTGAKKP